MSSQGWCSLCGHEIHSFQSWEPNKYSNETAHVHIDCAEAFDRRTDDYLDTKTAQVFASLTDRSVLCAQIGHTNRPGACANRGAGKR